MSHVILYGWFLMKPKTDHISKSSSTISGVAVSGYKSPGMVETDLFETGPIVERLERSKLLTSDGLEVELMGMINIEKSLSNNFSPLLVQCFMIGFPSTWIYMLLNSNIMPSKGYCSTSQSPSSGPSYSCGKPRDLRTDVEGSREHTNAGSVEANPIQSILNSRLFSASDEKPIESYRLLTKICTEPIQNGISKANSVPRSGDLDNGQVVRDHITCIDTDFSVNDLLLYPEKLPCFDPGFLSDKPLIKRQTSLNPQSCPPCGPVVSGLDNICQVPEIDNQTQPPPTSRCPLTGRKQLEEDGENLVLKSAEEQKIDGGKGGFRVCLDVSNGDSIALTDNQMYDNEPGILQGSFEISNSSHKQGIDDCNGFGHLEVSSRITEVRCDSPTEDAGFDVLPVDYSDIPCASSQTTGIKKSSVLKQDRLNRNYNRRKRRAFFNMFPSVQQAKSFVDIHSEVAEADTETLVPTKNLNKLFDGNYEFPDQEFATSIQIDVEPEKVQLRRTRQRRIV